MSDLGLNGLTDDQLVDPLNQVLAELSMHMGRACEEHCRGMASGKPTMTSGDPVPPRRH